MRACLACALEQILAPVMSNFHFCLIHFRLHPSVMRMENYKWELKLDITGGNICSNAQAKHARMSTTIVFRYCVETLNRFYFKRGKLIHGKRCKIMSLHLQISVTRTHVHHSQLGHKP
jgi:hypothetical protein